MLIEVEINGREAFIESSKVIGVRDVVGGLFLDLADDERSIKVPHNNVSRYNVSRLKRIFQPVIPANPGFELLICSQRTDDYFWFDRRPIIGWRLTEHMVEPIPVGELDDFETLPNPWAILCPNGSIDQPYVRSFDNLDAWREAAEKEWQKDHTEVKEAKNG
jgi:hypothetical protein